MATAEELLARMAQAETEPHIVVNVDRTITVPDQLRRLAVQYDHNAETVTFDCPRYWDGSDMSTMIIYINYFTPDNRVGCYPAKNVVIDTDDDTIMHFDWAITKNVTMESGLISFLVCINRVDSEGNEEYHWNSELYKGATISPGLECNTVIAEQYPDVITEIITKLRSIEVGGVVTDKTLTLEDYPAEAKAVGDKFEETMDEVDEKLQILADNATSELQKVNKKIDELPISVSEDGYTDISGLRQVTDISVVKTDDDITVTTTLQGDEVHVDTILLDEYDRPISGTSDGVAWTMSWDGFDV